MKAQTKFKDKRIIGYGCAACAVISEVLRACGETDFSDNQMDELLKEAFKASLSGNCWVNNWGLLGKDVMDVLGYIGTCDLVMLKRSGQDQIYTFSNKPVNGFIFQHPQVDSPGWSHFTGWGYNPDPTIKISSVPTGIRGLNIDIKGRR